MKRALLPLLMLLGALPLHAQRPQTAVVPQSITVGDVFQAAIRIQLPGGAEVLAPDSIPLPDQLELAGRREVRYDTANGGRRATITYPMTAWRPGAYELPTVELRVVGTGSESRVDAVLPRFTVSSVLPADTSGIEPKAAKDVFGANRVWWPILLVGLLLAALAAALFWWWRRRRGSTVEAAAPVPVVPPRQLALAQLDALRREGLVERGELRVYYGRMSEILRHYAAAIDSRWSVDLTTSELAGRVRAANRHMEMIELLRLLGTADFVKFARATIAADAARTDLDAARMWVERAGPRVDVVTPDDRKAA